MVRVQIAPLAKESVALSQGRSAGWMPNILVDGQLKWVIGIQ